MREAVINPTPSQGKNVERRLDAGALSELLACNDDLFIRRAYWVLLGREPDPGGFANYSERLRAGARKLRILQELAQSPEGHARGAALFTPVIDDALDIAWDQLQEKCGSAFLTSAYQVLLGREPDCEGQATYLAQLRNGAPRVEILAQLLHSDEYKARREGPPKSTLARRIASEVRRFQLSQLPLLGRLIRPLLKIEGDSPRDRRLRRIEFLLFELGQRDGSPVPEQES